MAVGPFYSDDSQIGDRGIGGMGCLAGCIEESKGNLSCKSWRLECAAHLFKCASCRDKCRCLSG